MRQAAGPLIENLPNVLTGDRSVVELSAARSSPKKRIDPFCAGCPMALRYEPYAIGNWPRNSGCVALKSA
jgi:hypothetical protein